MSSSTNNNINNSPNNYYKIRSNYYNEAHMRVNNSGGIPIDSSINNNNPKYLNVISTESSAWIPCVSLEYTGNEYKGNTSHGGIKISDGFNCNFKAETTFPKTNNGYNGCIAFTWTNKSLEDNAVPSNCYASNHEDAKTHELYGLLSGSLINDNTIKGFTLTLYPGNTYEYRDGDFYYTTKINRYMLAYKTTSDATTIEHIAGNLPESIDVYYDYNSLSVEHTSGKYNFYMNGILFASINDTIIDMDTWSETEGYFTATMISSPNIEASLDITYISDNYMHITNEEKHNLNNLGVSVLNYYSKEDPDYTNAFKTALANNRRVYVPRGTYKIREELVVEDNCELELAQDAVLEFDPAYFEVTIDANRDTITRNVDSPKTVNDVLDDPETFRCIILKMSSRLIGNQATIRVPYNFKGSVIYASTRSHPTGESIRSFEPFSRWDPQWKPARYLRDINITKPIEKGMTVKVLKTDIEIEQTKALKGPDYDPNVDIYKYSDLNGFHASIKNACYGTAVFIEGYRSTKNEGSTFIWGLDYSGLRIAGAFNYGIYGKNNYQSTVDDWSWTYDMKVDAIIDGCKVGVHLDHCSNSRISAIIQPRTAYFDVDDENKPPYAEYGIYLDECTNVDLTGSRVWDWDANHTLWAAGNENQHLRLKGDCKGLILDDFKYYANESYNLRDLIKVDDAKYLNNITILQEPVSKFFSLDTDTTKSVLFVDRKIDNETNPGEMITAYGMTTTDMIYCGRSDENAIEITVNDFDFNGDSDSLIAFYDVNYNYIGNAAISTTSITAPTGAKYFRISCKTDIIGDEPSVTVNGNTATFKNNYLKDHIYIKKAYVEGLQEMLDDLEDRIYKLEHPNDQDNG